jgi:hypothetical protein
MPHPHSLFLLADHHHHHDGSLDDEHEHEQGAAENRQSEIAGRKPIAQAATEEGAFGEQISLTVGEFGAAARTGASEPFIWLLHLPLTSRGEPPDPPPPRSFPSV